MERLTLLGLPLDPVDMEEALKRIGGFLQEERTHQVVTLNPEIAVRAQEDEALRRAVLGPSSSPRTGWGSSGRCGASTAFPSRNGSRGLTSPSPSSAGFRGSGSTSSGEAGGGRGSRPGGGAPGGRGGGPPPRLLPGGGPGGGGHPKGRPRPPPGGHGGKAGSLHPPPQAPPEARVAIGVGAPWTSLRERPGAPPFGPRGSAWSGF